MKDKFIIRDATDEIVIGGLGNLKGNLRLLKYSEHEIRQMIKENNNENDNIRLVNSLLKSLNELICEKQELIDYLKKYTLSEEVKEQSKDFICGYNFAIDNILSKIEKE